MEIKAILFDFGGTLDSDGADWFTRIYKSIVKRIGQVDQDEFQMYASQAADGISLLEDTHLLSMDATARRLCTHIHAKMNHTKSKGTGTQWDPEEVAEEFVSESGMYLKRNRQILGHLHKTFRIGCISNNWGNTVGWCRQFQLHHYFETMIDSTVVGAAKPNKKIFQAALNDLGLPPRNCAYVGDRYDCDILGAHAAGLIPIWITDGNNQNVGDLPVVPRRISRLSELLNMNWSCFP